MLITPKKPWYIRFDSYPFSQAEALKFLYNKPRIESSLASPRRIPHSLGTGEPVQSVPFTPTVWNPNCSGFHFSGDGISGSTCVKVHNQRPAECGTWHPTLDGSVAPKISEKRFQDTWQGWVASSTSSTGPAKISTFKNTGWTKVELRLN